MRLRRIEIRNFRKLVGPVVLDRLGDGLTVIAGDNEEGKSTLLAAIKAALFEHHAVGGAIRDAMVPLGRADAPEVSIAFELGGNLYELRKVFRKGAGTRLVTPAGELRDDAAEQRLQELLRFERRQGRAEPRPEHLGLQALFWVEQGTTFQGFASLAGARERLSRQEAQLADAARIADLAFWRLRLDSPIIEWSEESYRHYGVDPASFVPTREAVRALVVEEDRARAAAVIDRVIATGEPADYVFRHRRPDGAVRLRWTRASLERDAQGRPVAVRGISQDITDRERMHAALTQQQLLLAEAGRVAGLGFWRLRKGSDTLEWTDEVYRQMGETRESFVPTLAALYERMLPEDHEPTRAVAERVWRTGEPDSVVYRIRRPDGEIRWRWVSFAVERNGSGEIVAIAGASHGADKVKIGFVSTLSGPNASIGTDIRDGFQLAVKLAGGKLTVWSGLDAGTEVELSVLGPNAYSSPSPARSSTTPARSGSRRTRRPTRTGRTRSTST